MPGGKRAGSGRKPGSGAFGEPTIQIRVPLSLAPTVITLVEKQRVAADRRRVRKSPPATLKPLIPDQPITVLAPSSALETLEGLHAQGSRASAVILDPWYHPPSSSTKQRTMHALVELIFAAGRIADHVFIWGWPRQIAMLVERIPPPLEYADWLTWNAKNIPSHSRRWRNTHQACLHLCRKGAKFYPQHFMSESQQKRLAEGALKYIPAPSNIIEAGALIGWAGRSEKVNHPAQKPIAVFEALLRMSCKPGDLVVDPMAGSGTTGVVAQKLGLRAILADQSVRFTRLIRRRLAGEATKVSARKPRSKA